MDDITCQELNLNENYPVESWTCNLMNSFYSEHSSISYEVDKLASLSTKKTQVYFSSSVKIPPFPLNVLLIKILYPWKNTRTYNSRLLSKIKWMELNIQKQ